MHKTFKYSVYSLINGDMMDLQAGKPVDAESAALAARAHKAKMLFYDTAYGLLTNDLAMRKDIDSLSKAIKDSAREIERATSFSNYPYGMREKEAICYSTRKMCDSFSKLATAVSETACMKISVSKYLIMSGMANAKGIDHVHTYEIAKMLRNGSDGRVFEVFPDGIARPKSGAADAYTPEQLRAELNAIKALEEELDAKDPLYLDMLSLPMETKREFALQAIINSGKVSKSWDDELIEIASAAVKDFGRMGYLSPETTLNVLSDIETLKEIYSLSFSMAPKDSYDALKRDDASNTFKVPSIEVIPSVRLERR